MPIGTSEYRIVDKTIREWAAPCHASDGETVTVLSKAGVTEVNDEKTLYAAVGQFFVEIIIALRDSGCLSQLPRGEACYLGVIAMTACSIGQPPRNASLQICSSEDSMFRFTIRDLLWLMVVVGLVIGWCLDRPWQKSLLHQAFSGSL